MNDNRAVFASLVLSLAVNAAIVGSVELATARQAKLLELRLVRERRDKAVQFEFVEAPPKTRPEAPTKTHRISSRDALNQGAKADRAVNTPPSVPVAGPADQLGQRMGAGGSEAAPQANPAKLSAPVEPQAQRRELTPERKQTAEPTSAQATQPAPLKEPQPEKETDAVRMVSEPRPRATESAPSPSSKPKAASPGLPGSDKIATQEMAKKPSVSAKFFGFTSFETTGSGMGEYMKTVKEKVWLSWYPYLSFSYPTDYRSADVVLSVRLNAKGEVRSVTILDRHGDPAFATYCMSAIQKAGTFGPLPAEMLALLEGEELEIKFGFHYR